MTRDDPGDYSTRERSAAPHQGFFGGRSGSSDHEREGGAHLLIVDDEASIRVSLHRYFTKLGYRVSMAENGREALVTLSGSPPVDLVLTDLVMPGYDGRELILQMRTEHPTVPVIVISGYPAALLPDAGPDGKPLPFIAKPFALDAVAHEVRRLLHERSQRPHE
ncbi:MAG TPA: response regulator [Gemmatimonadaceae bacterium]|nr:response regulator [Gemmatimonadaceae bacterium]